MNISKRSAQELINQHFYDDNLVLTIADKSGDILATNADQTSMLRSKIIRNLIDRVNANISLTTKNIYIFRLHEYLNTFGYLIIQGPNDILSKQAKLIYTLTIMYLNSNYRFPLTNDNSTSQRANTFVRELIVANGSTNPFLLTEDAYFGFHLDQPGYVAAIFSSTGFSRDLINLSQFTVARTLRLTPFILIVLFQTDKTYQYMLRHINSSMYLGISTLSTNYLTNFHQTLTVIFLKEKLYAINKNEFSVVEKFLPIINSNIKVDNLVNELFQFDQTPENHTLLETFWRFFQNNGRIKQTADLLHIHRNTLVFRLKQSAQPLA
ncbi:PucR family transcriptional regulator [Leuconostoc citreum]|nr:helix-turn-helix domain-containing protein [Leuconostoc citreum]